MVIQILIIGYLIGCISFSRIISRLFGSNINLETETSFPIKGSKEKFKLHSISATTVAAKMGPVFGLTTTILDILKSFIPTYVLFTRFPDNYFHLYVSTAILLGHNYPIFYKFKGGRGMSPLYGCLLVLDWKTIPFTMICGIFFGYIIFRDMFFAFMSGPLFLFFWFSIIQYNASLLVFSLLVNILFWSATAPEIKMYMELKKKGVLQNAEKLERMELGNGGILKRFAKIFKKQNDE